MVGSDTREAASTVNRGILAFSFRGGAAVGGGDMRIIRLGWFGRMGRALYITRGSFVAYVSHEQTDRKRIVIVGNKSGSEREKDS